MRDYLERLVGQICLWILQKAGLDPEKLLSILNALGSKLNLVEFELDVSQKLADELKENLYKAVENLRESLEERNRYALSEIESKYQELKQGQALNRGVEDELDRAVSHLEEELTNTGNNVNQIYERLSAYYKTTPINERVSIAKEKARLLVIDAERKSAPGTSGEYKHHQVLALLQKEFSEYAKRDLSLAIELAVRDVLP